MEQEQSPEVAPHRAGTSRRVIVKSAAWSVPVFATVGVTPAFATTGRAIISSVSLSATRPTDSPGRIVNFTWDIAWDSDVTVSGPFTVAFTQPTGFAVVATSTLTASSTQLTFTGENKSANVFTVPSFTITVGFNYNGAKTATFTVAVPSGSIPSGGSVSTGDATITVTPGQNNPIH